MSDRPFNGALVLLVAAALAAEVVAQSAYTSPRDGFEIRWPAGFKTVPVPAGARRIKAQCLADDVQTSRSPDGGIVRHHPLIRVIEFPGRAAREIEQRKRARERAEAEKKAGAGAVHVREILLLDEALDYREFLRRYVSGGFHAVEERDLELRGIPVTHTEYIVDKLVKVPARIVTTTYHLPDRDLVVEALLLDDGAQRMRRRINGCLHSLRIIERSAASDERPKSIVAASSNEELARLWRERERAEREWRITQIHSNLPPGWRCKRTETFFVVSNADRKYERLILRQAREVRSWLERECKEIGEGKPLTPIIRLCATEAEARAYLGASGGLFAFDRGEVVCAQGGSLLGDFSRIARALTDQYFHDKDPAFMTAAPPFFAFGLGAFVEGSRISKKRSGLLFPLTRELVIEARRILAAQNPSVRDLMLEGRVGQSPSRLAAQELLVRFFLQGPGRKGKPRRALMKWLDACAERLAMEQEREIESSRNSAAGSGTSAPQSEEEERARRRAVRESFKKTLARDAERRRRILNEAFAAANPEWSENDWKKLQRAFVRFLEKPR